MLTKEVNAIATIIYNIRCTYLLADYYVMKQSLTSRAMNLAEGLRVEKTLCISLDLNKQIEKSFIEVPVKLELMKLMKMATRKSTEDPKF